MEDLASFVNFCKAFLRAFNNVGGESFSVLDQVFLDRFDQVVRAAADLRQIVDEFADLLKGQVAKQAFIDELLLNDFPEFIVLKIHKRCTFDSPG